MKGLLTILAVIVIGAFGAVGYLYSQDGGQDRIASLFQSAVERVSQLAPGGQPPSGDALTPAQGPKAEPAATAETPASPTQPLSIATASGQPTDETGPLRLGMPIDCVVGRNCLIQAFVDTDPGPGFADYRCGSLSFERNQGTQIRLPDQAAMHAGVNVLAVAPGEVLRVRDGLPDIDYRLIGREALGKSALGNVVLLRHRDGYITAYGHLKQGSIKVAEGDRVGPGQILGQVGLSGVSEYPHLHFEVRLNREVIDPFTGQVQGAGCGEAETAEPVWTSAALKQLSYHPTAVLRIGFAETDLNEAAVEYGLLKDTRSTVGDAADLILHVSVSGSRTGDTARLEIFGPSGNALASTSSTLTDDAAVRLLRAGPDKATAPLAPGTYSGVFTLTRLTDGESRTVISAQTEIQVE